jgi:flagellar protein FliS
MNNHPARSALNQYQKVGLQSAVEQASPHRLIQMLMEGALSRIASAIGHMARGETEAKGRQISLAISIIDGLRGSLDQDKGGEIASNLDRLYDYMCRRLLEANLKNDTGMLTEVQSLMHQIKSGWDAISDQSEMARASAPEEVAAAG